jgi:hypothetical protein
VKEEQAKKAAEDARLKSEQEKVGHSQVSLL